MTTARATTALQRKLFRDLSRLKGQVGTIALVLACGIGAVIALRGTLLALERAQAAFYERQRFADVFASLERAPSALRDRLEAIPGVARVQTRLRDAATIPMAGVPQPIRAEVLGLPSPEEESLNAIGIDAGRRPLPGRDDEIVLLSSFARAHRLTPGDRLRAVIAGSEHTLQVVGTAVSPEFVVALAPGSMTAEPDRFAVIWMNADAAAKVLRMEGAFNDVALDLTPGVSASEAIDTADRLLEPYGGAGAYDRSRQPSERMVRGELSQLRGMATIMPGVFLAVSALLVNLVLSRLVRLQQPEIATLKALGYSGFEVGLHFLEFALVVATLGGVVGVAIGSLIGNWMVGIYSHWFKFPGLEFRTDVAGTITGLGIGFSAACAGAMAAVAHVARLAPAEAMQPPAPARYRRSWMDAAGFTRWIGPSVSMIRRELTRRPLRAIASAAAIASSTALSVVGAWHHDGIRALVQLQFQDVMREDLNVTFVRPLAGRGIRTLAHLPGVVRAEGLRAVPVRFVAGSRKRDGALLGYEREGQLRMPRDRYGRAVALPREGVVLTEVLASLLGLRRGDSVAVEVKEGRRQKIEVRVADTVDDGFGLQGHMMAESLDALLGEEHAGSMALLSVERGTEAEIGERLKKLPAVLTVTSRARLIRDFDEQSGSMLLTTALVITLFAATITVGVVYNNARAALAARSRDLASLRILGFTRSEVSSVLLGEIAIQVLFALPFGLIAGRYLVQWLASTTDPESYRMPVLLGARTYAFSALVTITAAVVSGLIVRRRIDQLDLVSVLKARE